MANILVPTNFTPASLRWAEEAIRRTVKTSANIILFHAFRLPSDPFDLLGNTYRDPFVEMVNEPFRLACKQLKDEYPQQVSKIFTKCLNGDTKAVFRNFIEANDIDLIYCPDEFLFTKVHDRSVDPMPLFRNCGVPVINTSGVVNEPVFSNPKLGVLRWLQSS